ncbi:thioredoxin-like protein [Pyronema omphalodes]|nr:thioredoxin-like protein [Pyronema omphalodes]
MFRFHKTLDVLTLFHSATSPASVSILNTLKTASAHAISSSLTGKNPTASFELDVIEAPNGPTPDQLKSIVEFVGKNRVGDLVRGAGSFESAMAILKRGSEAFVRPTLVDWSNGRAVINPTESEVKELVETLPRD